jgi:hypothetical protein
VEESSASSKNEKIESLARDPDTFIRIEEHEERGYKKGDAKTRVERVSVLNGDSYHTFHLHQTSLLPTQLTPAFTPQPPPTLGSAKKVEGEAQRCTGVVSN